MIIKLKKLKCNQCDYTWTPRVQEIRRCPKCQSIDWDREKKIREIKNISLKPPLFSKGE